MRTTEPGSENAPCISENIAERERPENHQHQHKPHRLAQQHRTVTHNPQRKDDQHDRDANPEEAEPFADDIIRRYRTQLATPIAHRILRRIEHLPEPGDSLVFAPIDEIGDDGYQYEQGHGQQCKTVRPPLGVAQSLLPGLSPLRRCGLLFCRCRHIFGKKLKDIFR